MSGVSKRSWLVATAAFTGLLAIAGCAGPSRTMLTDEQLRARGEADMAETRQSFNNAIDKMLERVEVESRRDDGRLDILAISGGGDRGAFGAGFLVGWGEAPGNAARPEFDVVTGVSTGALIAPFAFIGTEDAFETVESFYRNPKQDWLRSRGLLFFLPSNPSFVSIPGLERDIRSAVDRDFIESLAQESREGKVLVVSATDLDFGRQKFWDVGAEAERANDDAGIERVQNILLSSAAIPAVFPPVQIGEAVYADGGVTANVFLRLERRDPNSLLMRWREEKPGTPLPPVRYWIIVNNQLEQIPGTVQVRWPSVINPSLATAVRSATITEIKLLTAQADYVNAIYGTDIEVRVIAIPNEWRPPVPGQFQEETMRSLVDLGREMGADPASWTLWTTPVERQR